MIGVGRSFVARGNVGRVVLGQAGSFVGRIVGNDRQVIGTVGSDSARCQASEGVGASRSCGYPLCPSWLVAAWGRAESTGSTAVRGVGVALEVGRFAKVRMPPDLRGPSSPPRRAPTDSRPRRGLDVVVEDLASPIATQATSTSSSIVIERAGPDGGLRFRREQGPSAAGQGRLLVLLVEVRPWGMLTRPAGHTGQQFVAAGGQFGDLLLDTHR